MEIDNKNIGKKKIYAIIISAVLLTNCLMALAGVVAEGKSFGSFSAFGLKSKNSTNVAWKSIALHSGDDLSFGYLKTLFQKTYPAINGYSTIGPTGFFTSGPHGAKGRVENSSLSFIGPGSLFNESNLSHAENTTPVSGFFFGAPFFFNTFFNPYTALVTGGIIVTTNNEGPGNGEEPTSKENNEETQELLTFNLDENGNNNENTNDPTYRETPSTETHSAPEPATMALLASGLVGMAIRKKVSLS